MDSADGGRYICERNCVQTISTNVANKPNDKNLCVLIFLYDIVVMQDRYCNEMSITKHVAIFCHFQPPKWPLLLLCKVQVYMYIKMIIKQTSIVSWLAMKVPTHLSLRNCLHKHFFSSLNHVDRSWTNLTPLLPCGLSFY